METKNELTTVVEKEILEIQDRKDMKTVCTLDRTKEENQILIYNAMQQCDVLLNDMRGEELEIIGAYLEVKKLPKLDDNGNEVYNEKTGEIIEVDKYKTILFDKEHKSYVTMSYGLFNSMLQILTFFGRPSEEKPLKLKVTTRKTKNNRETLILQRV